VTPDAPVRAKRTYRSLRREDQARQTAARILTAAVQSFLERGYGVSTMASIAAAAGVSVPTVEARFGTKAHLLKAAVDTAIAGDDEPVPMLDRAWVTAARQARNAEDALFVVAAVLGAAQARSAGLLLALFEGASTDPELSILAEQMIAQRGRMAAWLVDALAERARLARDCSRDMLLDTVWILMDPALFDRLTRQRHWTLEQYEHWFARSIRRLLTDEPAAKPAHHL